MARIKVKTLYMREWSRNNKEKCRENCRKYHNELKDDEGYKQDKIDRVRKWRLENPEKYIKLKKSQNIRRKKMDNSRLKFRVWDRKEKCYMDIPMFLRKDGVVGFQTYTSKDLIENLITEQCTGLKDKSGKLIYEGDKIKTTALLNDHSQRGATEELVVKNFAGNSCLCFEGQESGVPIYPFCISHTIEIIGNTHE